MAEPAVPEKPKKIPFGQILFSVLGFFAYLAVEFLFIGALIFGSKEEHSSGVVRTGLLYATDGLY